MNKNLKLLVFSFVIGFIFNNTPVLANRIPWDDPVCKISGTVESVVFEDEYNNPCLDLISPFGPLCPTDTTLHLPERYALDIKIKNVSLIKEGTGVSSCEDIFQINKVKKFYIDKDKIKSGDSFSGNQEIEVVNNPSSSNFLDSYVLKMDKKSPKDIPATQKTDRKTYEINVIKTGKLFFLIPISYNIQKTIDSNTGIALYTQKPWWTFLVGF